MICERCGKEIEYEDSHTVTCKHITFWEHDTERYLCSKCYEKFQKYMKNHYEKFFIHRIYELKGGINND